MYFRLALGNVRKSARDYAVYFLTLALGVAIFYAFNSIAVQAEFLSKSVVAVVQTIALLVNWLTYFLVVVLGCLMVYANNYLVRRRKQELGLYQLLGMTRGQVSLVLVLETLMASAASFLVGLAVGVLVSQLLVFVTAAIFRETVTAFHFAFSPNAALFTLVCFACIFAVMLLFNIRAVGKLQLVDLMGARRKNERMAVRSIPATVVMGAGGIAMIAYAYSRLLRDGYPLVATEGSPELRAFLLTTAIVTVGTFLLFYSLSGILAHGARVLKGLYWRDLNMFTIRQLSSRVNSVAGSLGVITMVLFLALSSVSGGFGINRAMEADMVSVSPYSATIAVLYDPEGPSGPARPVDLEALIAEKGLDLGSIAESAVQVTTYAPDANNEYLLMGELVDKTGVSLPSQYESSRKQQARVVSLSEYNAIRRSRGLLDVALGANEYLVASSMGETVTDVTDAFVEQGSTITLAGRELAPVPGQRTVTDGSAVIYDGYTTYATFVVPDDVVEGLPASQTSLNVDYLPSVTEEPNDFYDDVARALDTSDDFLAVGSPSYSRSAAMETLNGTSAIILYLAIYIGLVLVISCAAILAIQQLSNAADAAPSYRLLNELGCPQRMANRSLLAQVSLFFALPLVVAAGHTTVALIKIYDLVKVFATAGWVPAIVSVAAVFVLIYGLYLALTYLMARSAVAARAR